MDKTVWKDAGKKWKARNKQAALIFTKAKPFHLPLPPGPIIVETKKAMVERENKERSERVKLLKIEQAIRKADSDRKQAEEQQKQWEKRKKRFRKKQTAKLQRLAEKIASKLNR